MLALPDTGGGLIDVDHLESPAVGKVGQGQALVIDILHRGKQAVLRHEAVQAISLIEKLQAELAGELTD